MSSRYNSNDNTSTADIRLKLRKISPLTLDTFSVRPYMHMLMKILGVAKARVTIDLYFFSFFVLLSLIIMSSLHLRTFSPIRID